MRWHPLAPTKQLRLANTLRNGQCFNWQTHPGDAAVFVGVVAGREGHLPVELRETCDRVEFRCLGAREVAEDKVRVALEDYFQLSVDMENLYLQWSKTSKRTRAICGAIPGMRVVRQDPFECLISFICSSNNNIQRITSLLSKLRTAFGKLCSSPGIEPDLYTFPTLARLADVEEETLRSMGFGYRAKYIASTVSKLNLLGGESWLYSLRDMGDSVENQRKIRESLMQLDGVGPKVADCVALFCLDRQAAIPVDTHVWHIACRDFDSSLIKSKSLTSKIYDRVGDLFRESLGSHCGWAHCLLFAAELPYYRDKLPRPLQEEMKEFSLEEKRRKEAESRARRALRDQGSENRPRVNPQIGKQTTEGESLGEAKRKKRRRTKQRNSRA